VKVSKLTNKELYRLLLRVQKAYGFNVVVERSLRPGLEQSPLIDAGVPKAGKYLRTPRTVYTIHNVEDLMTYAWASMGILHEMTHLALWHPTLGVYGITESGAVVLETAWAEALLGQKYRPRMLETLKGVGVPYDGTVLPFYDPNASLVGDWKEPRKTKWWHAEARRLQALGVLDENRKPTYKVAKWEGIDSGPLQAY
jgi:hypothetical protein